MKFWKTAALAMGFVAAAGLGAVLTPAIHGQTRAPRIVTPRAAEVFWSGGGSRLGVSITDVSADDSKTKGNAGVLIDDVDEDSPAAKAGLKKGDIVVEFDGDRVRSVRQFTRLVSETPAGRTVTAAVMRDGQRVSLSVTPREGNNFRFFDECRTGILGRGHAADSAARTTPAVGAAPAVAPPGGASVARDFLLALGQQARDRHRRPVTAAGGVFRDEGGCAGLVRGSRLRRRQGRRKGRRCHHNGQ